VTFDPSLPDGDVNVSHTHPLREALVLVAGVAGVGIALFLAIAMSVEILVPWIPPSFEARIFSGEWIDEALGPDSELATDARAERVAALLDRLVQHWPENPYTLRVAIHEESTPNALAFPGGFIVVTSGLLDQIESENELAFVLSHELGHFRNRDHLRGIGRGLAFALVIGAVGLGGSGGAAQLASLSGQLTARGFDREQESDADHFGLVLVHAEYGHVAGAWDFFGRLPDPSGTVEKEVVHYLATHPLNEDRIDALESSAAEQGWPRSGPLVLFVDE